jgi:hypothetical protein
MLEPGRKADWRIGSKQLCGSIARFRPMREPLLLLGRERPMRLVVMAAALGARGRSRDTLPDAYVGPV